MRLARLTALEREKIDAELKEVRALIKDLKDILGSKPRRVSILVDEMQQVAKTFGDDRRTEIIPDQADFAIEDLIAEEDMVISISHSGYIKRIPISTYRRQRRGGRGVTGATAKEDDWIEHLFIASTHDYVLFFSDKGQVYWLKVHEIPQGGRAARGKPVIQTIAIRPDERVTALVPVRTFDDQHWLMFATRQGTVKKTVLSAYGNPRSNGINAINIEKGDELIDVQVTDGNNDIALATSDGMSIRFHESDVREMGRATTGVKGIELDQGDKVIGMVVIRRDATLLVVTEKGLGKRSELAEYRVQKRGGKGLITLKRTDKTGGCVALKEVLPDDELMMITRHGIIIRVPVKGISVIGRITQGVRVMNLDEGDTIVGVARVVKEDEDGAEEPTGDEVTEPAGA
jgi:DNA gyrase subunit A